MICDLIHNRWMRLRALSLALLLSALVVACTAQEMATTSTLKQPDLMRSLAAGATGPTDPEMAGEAADSVSTPDGTNSPAVNSKAADDESASAQKIGAVFQCERFSGADVSIKEKACNAAAVAAGGGTIDLRTLLAGNTTGSEQMEIDTREGNRHNIGVTALFPTSGTYTTTMVGGPAVKATVYAGRGGSGYISGCTVVPSETGFAFTGVARGAVFSVTAVNGVVKELTLISGGGGYLSSKFVSAANGSCTGSGLIVNLQAADCGVRLNGSGTIETGSVGAGATTFQIVPSRNNTGFVVDSLFCTDEEGGYVRQEGGLKGTNISPGALAVTGTSHIRAVVDNAQFNLLESSTKNDDGVRIDGACCGTNFYSLHANNGNSPQAGYPIIIGSGGVIQNACTTSGSNIITAPYAHFTAEYRGDTVGAGVQGGSTNFPPGQLIVTEINSFTSITVSAKATATNSTNATCTAPALTGGTGLTLKLSDTTIGTSVQVSLYHPVFNGPAPGLQNILITGNVSGLSILGAYLESNSVVDDYTSQVYIGYPAAEVNFYNLFVPGPQHGGTKYGIESETPLGWCMFGGITFTGLLDQGVVIPPAASKNMVYCKGGIPGVVNSTNLLPDTDFKQGDTWWSVPPGVRITGGIGPSGDNAIAYDLTGDLSGLVYIPVRLPVPNLQSNLTYTAGAYVNFTGGSSGSVNVKVCSTANCSGATYASAYVNSGVAKAGIISARFSAAAFNGPYFVIELENVKGSGTLTVSEPFLVAGNLASYTENDSGFGSFPNQSVSNSKSVNAGYEPAGGSTNGSATARAQRVLAGACTGTAPSSATNLVIYPFGTSSPSCSSTLNPLYGALMPAAGTVSGLAVRCGTTGSSKTSGVFTIVDYPNGGGSSRPTGVTVTYGAAPAKTVVRDTTHSYSYAAGDLLVVLYTTESSETLANCAASFLY